MLKVGLTGSIAVGKSFVCKCFAELGCHILDADKTSREVVARGSAGLHQIVSEFGDAVLLPDGSLDRKKMASIVFSSEKQRQLLNSIVHPLVREKQDRWIGEIEKTDSDGVAIVDAALLIESAGYKRLDKLIVVWCEPAIQLRRLMLRDCLNETDAERRITAQMPQNEKKSFADYLIDTSSGFEDTKKQTIQVFQQLIVPSV